MNRYEKAVALVQTVLEATIALRVEMQRIAEAENLSDEQVFSEIKSQLDENDRIAFENAAHFQNLLASPPTSGA